MITEFSKQRSIAIHLEGLSVKKSTWREEPFGGGIGIGVELEDGRRHAVLIKTDSLDAAVAEAAPLLAKHFASTRPVGRPPHYDDPTEFERLADEYYEACLATEAMPTVNGLALHLGFNSRQSLLNYEGKPEFVDVVKKARTRLELAWEQKLAGPNAAGTIFWLKNQGWSDKTEQEISGPGGGPIPTTITVVGVTP